MAEENLENFKKIYDEHFTDLYDFLLRVSQNSELASDLTQDTFLRLYRKYGNSGYSDIRNLRAYLFTIGKRLYFNHYRKKKRETKATVELQENLKTGLTGENVSDWDVYFTTMYEALKKENEVFSLIFLLRVRYDYSFTEIAKIIGKTTRTIRRYMAEIKEIIQKNE